jgi:hypothetical protein
MHEWPIFVISSGARDLAFSATCEEKISRLGLEMTIATQSPREEQTWSNQSSLALGISDRRLQIPYFWNLRFAICNRRRACPSLRKVCSLLMTSVQLRNPPLIGNRLKQFGAVIIPGDPVDFPRSIDTIAAGAVAKRHRAPNNCEP